MHELCHTQQHLTYEEGKMRNQATKLEIWMQNPIPTDPQLFQGILYNPPRCVGTVLLTVMCKVRHTDWSAWSSLMTILKHSLKGLFIIGLLPTSSSLKEDVNPERFWILTYSRHFYPAAHLISASIDFLDQLSELIPRIKPSTVSPTNRPPHLPVSPSVCCSSSHNLFRTPLLMYAPRSSTNQLSVCACEQ